MKVELLTSLVQTRHQIANAVVALGQCYQSKNMNADKVVKIAMVNKHRTVLECFDLMFLIKGISYSSHVHFIRHRFTTPFVQSQRYTNVGVTRLSEDILDKLDQEDLLKLAKYDQFVSSLYHSKKLTLEEQRHFKPQGVLINMCLKTNLRELLDVIIPLRADNTADKATQKVAKAMLAEVKKNEVLALFLKEETS